MGFPLLGLILTTVGVCTCRKGLKTTDPIVIAGYRMRGLDLIFRFDIIRNALESKTTLQRSK
jgi:hypothetical protein